MNYLDKLLSRDKPYRLCYIEEFVLFSMIINPVKSRIVVIEIVLTKNLLYILMHLMIKVINMIDVISYMTMVTIISALYDGPFHWH